MDSTPLLVDLHRHNARLGPGSDEHTRLALALSGLLGRSNLNVADIGCGTGASTLVLAESLDAHITALDLFPEFLTELEQRARARGLGARIRPLAASMDALPFEAGSLDALWSEGAIYNLGFEAGVAAWRAFLKPGGVLAVSEITWLTAARPAELEEHWVREYSEVATASAKLAVLERQGYTPIGYFALPEACWLDNYYRPLRARFKAFLARYEGIVEARAIVEAEEYEIGLYERYREYVSYGFYVARRNAD